MVEIDHSEIGNNLIVNIENLKVDSMVIKKPFYDPKKKITSA